MTTVTATTAPDFAGPVLELPRLDDSPGATLELLVLAANHRYCAGVDLASGALVRTWSPAGLRQPLRPYDTAQVTLAAAIDCIPDPSEPEGLPLVSPPEPTGRLGGRRVERLLRPLLHPGHEPLLGTHAPAVPFWERRPDRPSIAVVQPEGAGGRLVGEPPAVLARSGPYLACRFLWRGTAIELPCVDRRAAAAMDRAGRRRMGVDRGTRLVVALNPPIDGHCHKVVEAVLPRP
jgi:hypothetical protein